MKIVNLGFYYVHGGKNEDKKAPKSRFQVYKLNKPQQN